MGIVASDALGFNSDLQVFPFGSAPAVNDYDFLFVNSDTTIATPTGFTLLDSSVVQQGAYAFYRKAIGGETDSVTIDPNGAHEAVCCWARARNVVAIDKNTKTSVTNTQAETGPTATTATLSETGELSISWAALHRFASSTPTGLSFSNGYSVLESASNGTGATAVMGILGYKEDAGTTAETTSASWTNNVYDRDCFIVTLTMDEVSFVAADPLDVQGELNRIAGTSGRGEAYCANLIAGTNGLETVGALNTYVGNARINWIDLQGVANQMAGTNGLGTAKALSMVAPV